MFGLEGLTFATPLALGALALLPVIWWLLRFTPPRPDQVRFPPFRLLLELVVREEETDKTPWWLVLLRLALAAVVIIAVAQPFLSDGRTGATPSGPTLIVLDNGWTAAGKWDVRRSVLNDIIETAQRAGNPVALAVTTPTGKPSDLAMTSPATLKDTAGAIEPVALSVNRSDLLERLKTVYANADALTVYWLSDGVDGGDAAQFAEGLGQLAGGNATVRALLPAPSDAVIALSEPELKDGTLTVFGVTMAGTAERKIDVELAARNGRSLSSVEIAIPAGSTKAKAEIDLPVELRNEAAVLRVSGQRSAGSVYLFDDRWRRKTVALLSGASLELEQPLLSPLYYVSRALEPIAEVARIANPEDLKDRLNRGLSLLVLADVGQVTGPQREAISRWMENGGVLLRFAGPRLAAAHDDMVPVELRTGGRSLGSALSWEQPQNLSAFPTRSPFTGLTPDPSVRVSRQVLAEPAADLSDRVWASLEDGTPLITAARRGKGLVVLFHITANADWSNLPLSGLFVELLKRVVDLAPGAGSSGTEATFEGAVSGPYVPVRGLSGFGALTNPAPEAAPVAAKDIDTITPGPFHPPGLYRRASINRAINVQVPDNELKPIGNLPAGVTVSDYAPSPSVPLAGALFAIALGLFLLDCIAALALSGSWRRLRPGASAAAVLIAVIGLTGAAPELKAQDTTLSAADRFAMRSVLETRLAYVVTGRQDVDQVSFAGLSGLNDTLIRRTAIEPGVPTGVDIERDSIVFFPLLYWPVLPDAKPLSAAVAAKIDTFMKNGGTIFFDTRDHNANGTTLTGAPSPSALALRRLLASLDIPPLEPVPPEHVLTKAFYLLQSFPGRWNGGQLWVEAGHNARTSEPSKSDGVSSIIIGSNDYAAAWATDNQGRAMFPVVPGGERQREFAFRTGVNIVMYALTGNYKADQVHIPALLERLGQ